MDERRAMMLRYLVSDDARAAAGAELRRRGLDVCDPDDLVHDVALRVLRAELPHEVANPVAYARRALTYRAADLLRGERVRSEHAEPPGAPHDDGADGPGDPWATAVEPDAVDPAVEAAALVVEDALRRALHLRLAVPRTRVWAVAAALTTLTLRIHRDVAVPADAPRPGSGSEAQADRWVALWLAGEGAVFPATGRGDGPALRKARSRRLQEVDDLLRDVADVVLGGDVDG